MHHFKASTLNNANKQGLSRRLRVLINSRTKVRRTQLLLIKQGGGVADTFVTSKTNRGGEGGVSASVVTCFNEVKRGEAYQSKLLIN